MSQVMLEMSPGMGMDKNILSVHDLKSHKSKVKHWGPPVFIEALLKSGFDATLANPESQTEESLAHLVCYGSEDVSLL